MEVKMRIHESAYVADGAVILGDVSVGEESSIWFHVTIRADRDKIVIGSRSNIQDNAVVHVDKGFPAYIGDGVTVGHGAVIHGCRIGDNAIGSSYTKYPIALLTHEADLEATYLFDT